MTPAELLVRLKAGEDTLTELKTKGAESVVRRALVAFANSATPERAGVLFIGVKPDGEPVGLENPTSLAEKVATWSGECYPPIRSESVILSVDGVEVLTIVVPASPNRPHFAGPAYVRDGPRTIPAPPQVYEDLNARECRIESCSAHSVEVRELASSALYSIPLDRVEISGDPVRQRPFKLVIRGRIAP